MPTQPSQASMKIAELVAETGVSKDLIHHYLRLGLLPKPTARAKYDSAHVRLLKLVRLFRDEHQLPLEVIRGIFDMLGFEPARIELLTWWESLGKRITAFVSRAELVTPNLLSTSGVCERAGVSADRIAEYVESKVISPIDNGVGERFSIYDANAVALGERGRELGIDLDSFRTIASHVRVAFQLEFPALVEGVVGTGASADDLAARLFLIREVAGSFVQNVLLSLILQRYRQSLEPAQPAVRSVEELVYRPSEAFRRRHGLDRRIEAARSGLGRGEDGPEPWRRVAELLLRAGDYREAVFFLEEGLQKWPEVEQLKSALGRALVLCGRYDRALEVLEPSTTEATLVGSVRLSTALARYFRAADSHRTDRLLGEAGAIRRDLEAALRALNPTTPWAERIQTEMLCGWLLIALPASAGDLERGAGLLSEALLQTGDLEGGTREGPGQVEALRINAAYLLARLPPPTPPAEAEETVSPRAQPGPAADRQPDREELVGIVCRLDPLSGFARQLFLAEEATADATGGTNDG